MCCYQEALQYEKIAYQIKILSRQAHWLEYGLLHISKTTNHNQYVHSVSSSIKELALTLFGQ